ncbi:alpha/beta hydrolase [Nocardia thailandica]|uniref:alpha/beta hydrolase n=1 Tax=Nocardia thailandica TaxID=257275 RepID=UPI0005BCCB47|nr:alpha/beta hydrolase family protein [Nocardia thailandica]
MRPWHRLLLCSVLLPAAVLAGRVPAAAVPGPAEVLAAARAAPDGSRVTGVSEGPGRLLLLRVYSAAMDAVFEVRVLRAADPSAPAPVLYLLNGAHGGTDASSWTDQTDVADFFADDQVTVVVPMGGRGSYFTDWRADDPVLGRQRWKTFLTEELPPIVDATFAGTGANAIAGISMGGTSVFQLAAAKPGLFRAVGSYSGCVGTSDPQGQAMVSAVVTRWSGNPANMWGPPGDPAWAANDPAVHADLLRGTTIYVSSGTGLPGEFDTLDGPGIAGNPGKLAGQLTNGGVLEAVTHACTLALRARLDAAGVPATFVTRPFGTHSWGYWQRELHESWPGFAEALRR